MSSPFSGKSEKKDRAIEMGSCRRPHGIKGGLTLRVNNLEESILEKGVVVTLYPLSKESSISSEGERWTIEKISFGNKVIAYFEGLNDRNVVERMIPFSLYLNRSEFPSLEDEETFYLEDLKGLKVLLSDDKSPVGEVERFYDNGAQVVLVIKTPRGPVELPFIDQFFPLVDLDQGFLEVVLPEFR